METRIYETIQNLVPGTTYSLCDGITRFRPVESAFKGNFSQKTSLVTVTGNFRPKYTQIYSLEPDSSPQCQLTQDTCNFLWASFLDEDLGDFKFAAFRHPPLKPCPKYRECQVQIDEVVIIYWSPKVKSGNICASNRHHSPESLAEVHGYPNIITTDAITFRGQDLYLRELSNDYTNTKSTPHYISSSVMSGNFTFTSPTIYLAYRPITTRESFFPFAGDENSLPGPSKSWTRPAGTIELKSEDIWTVRPILPKTMNGFEYAQQVAKGEFNYTFTTNSSQPYYTERLPIEFNDLQDPIPASVYYDARVEDCWGRQSHCGTITDDSYRPKLFLKKRIWDSLIPRFDCALPVLVDPPIVLHPINGLFEPPTIHPPAADPFPTQHSPPTQTQNLPYPAHVYQEITPSPTQMDNKGISKTRRRRHRTRP
jgi:hypothetical protein